MVSRPPRVGEDEAQKFLRKNIAWVKKRLAAYKKVRDKLYTPGGTREDYEARKEEARKFVTTRLAYFNEFYRFKYGRVSIRNQRTRWGSCSIDGNLSFNYKIIALPIRMADYIIVHELCHVGEFNHSEKFWRLVGKAIPEYQKIRKQLRGHGMGIQ